MRLTSTLSDGPVGWLKKQIVHPGGVFCRSKKHAIGLGGMYPDPVADQLAYQGEGLIFLGGVGRNCHNA